MDGWLVDKTPISYHPFRRRCIVFGKNKIRAEDYGKMLGVVLGNQVRDKLQDRFADLGYDADLFPNFERFGHEAFCLYYCALDMAVIMKVPESLSERIREALFSAAGMKEPLMELLQKRASQYWEGMVNRDKSGSGWAVGGVFAEAVGTYDARVASLAEIQFATFYSNMAAQIEKQSRSLK